VAAAPGEDDSTRLRRAALVRLVAAWPSAAVLAEARRRLDAYLATAALSSRTWPTRSSRSPRAWRPALYDRYRAAVAAAASRRSGGASS